MKLNFKRFFNNEILLQKLKKESFFEYCFILIRFMDLKRIDNLNFLKEKEEIKSRMLEIIIENQITIINFPKIIWIITKLEFFEQTELFQLELFFIHNFNKFNKLKSDLIVQMIWSLIKLKIWRKTNEKVEKIAIDILINKISHFNENHLGFYLFLFQI